MKTLILENIQIIQKINRLAYQVYESNYNEKKIIIAGIAPNGYVIAERLKEVLENISGIEIQLIKLTVDKKNPLQHNVHIESNTPIDVKDQCVIVVDDVLNTGKTMIYGVKYFLDAPLKKLQTLVLIDRDHKQFPIRADFVGLALSTNLQEHVSVEINDDISVYLS